jgi:hypothetical protein
MFSMGLNMLSVIAAPAPAAATSRATRQASAGGCRAIAAAGADIAGRARACVGVFQTHAISRSTAPSHGPRRPAAPHKHAAGGARGEKVARFIFFNFYFF